MRLFWLAPDYGKGLSGERVGEPGTFSLPCYGRRAHHHQYRETERTLSEGSLHAAKTIAPCLVPAKAPSQANSALAFQIPPVITPGRFSLCNWAWLCSRITGAFAAGSCTVITPPRDTQEWGLALETAEPSDLTLWAFLCTENR
ncbi:hypothetical protein KIL84_005473 [Mauremys mutica]|uniref:Uncharacterized protein n=1 Tax=Mauremys mutica TaxID=74926 RepID=A0A9D3XKS0_9SAUR|nr:hypothetical protein KIL84_005473 [Mauremys mutica]